MPVYPELRRLRQKDWEFKASIDYVISSQPTWSLSFETLLETLKKRVSKKKKRKRKCHYSVKLKFALTYPLDLVLTL